MAKVAEDAALELELNDERIERKIPRNIQTALTALGRQRTRAQERFDEAEAELKTIDAMIALAKA